MYENFRNIQIELTDDTLEFVTCRDLDTGNEISKEGAAGVLEGMVTPDVDRGVAARIMERISWLRSLSSCLPSGSNR